jgi:1,4-dihydroxy-2-naphthoyl-CoA hydrolase
MPPPSAGQCRGLLFQATVLQTTAARVGYRGAMTTTSASTPAPSRESPFRRQASVERLNELSRGTAMEPLGIVFTEIGADYVRGTMPVDARTRQPYGLLHGGASVLLAETLGSSAGNLCVPEGKVCVGLEINANHVRAVRGGTVTGTARPVHVGGRTQVWEIRIEDEAGQLACISRLTLAVVSAG